MALNLTTFISLSPVHLRRSRRPSEDAHLVELRWWFAGIFFHLLVVCSLCEGFVVRTSPGEGVHPPHPDALLGEVSSQSSVVDLLHVLLDFSFGVLQQVRLTLKTGNGGKLVDLFLSIAIKRSYDMLSSCFQRLFLGSWLERVI